MCWNTGPLNTRFLGLKFPQTLINTKPASLFCTQNMYSGPLFQFILTRVSSHLNEHPPRHFLHAWNPRHLPALPYCNAPHPLSIRGCAKHTKLLNTYNWNPFLSPRGISSCGFLLSIWSHIPLARAACNNLDVSTMRKNMVLFPCSRMALVLCATFRNQ